MLGIEHWPSHTGVQKRSATNYLDLREVEKLYVVRNFVAYVEQLVVLSQFNEGCYA
jgi:hypothetical protein